jgi:hypothetical protein
MVPDAVHVIPPEQLIEVEFTAAPVSVPNTFMLPAQEIPAPLIV